MMINTKMMKLLGPAVALLLPLLTVYSSDLPPLPAAIEAGDAPAVTRLLADGVNLEGRDHRGWTPLIIAANAGNVAIAKLLVEKGADVNTRSTSTIGSTVLCFAAQHDNPALLDLLLQHGANINGRSKSGGTALYTAVSDGKEPAVRLLILKGAKLDQLAFMNERGCLLTPLMCAACKGNARFVEILLANGANLEKRNNFGNTALMETAMRPQPELVKFLIEHGANINARNPKGYTALLHAIDYGQAENIKVLLAAGADPFASYRITDDPADRSWDGVDLAKMHHDKESAALILEAQKRGQVSASPSN